MNIVLLVLAFLVVMSFITAYVKCYELSIAFELNLLNSPFYKLGIFSERYHLDENGQYEDEVTIGLFFLNIVFTFWNPGKDFKA